MGKNFLIGTTQMKILFIENREKTWFWERVALYLKLQGFQIAWLVQNPLFQPRSTSIKSEIYVLPFPPKSNQPPDAEALERVLKNNPEVLTDRGRIFFGAGASHYEHYKSQISIALDSTKPDIVIGEATLFHELITIGLCRAKGLVYIQPMSNRYPSGRFSLFAFDTQIPIIESGESWELAMVNKLVGRISSNTETPFYMNIPARNKMLRG